MSNTKLSQKSMSKELDKEVSKEDNASNDNEPAIIDSEEVADESKIVGDVETDTENKNLDQTVDEPKIIEEEVTKEEEEERELQADTEKDQQQPTTEKSLQDEEKLAIQEGAELDQQESQAVEQIDQAAEDDDKIGEVEETEDGEETEKVEQIEDKAVEQIESTQEETTKRRLHDMSQLLKESSSREFKEERETELEPSRRGGLSAEENLNIESRHVIDIKGLKEIEYQAIPIDFSTTDIPEKVEVRTSKAKETYLEVSYVFAEAEKEDEKARKLEQELKERADKLDGAKQIEEPSLIKFDRELYFKKYDELQLAFENEKTKNLYLQKKMTEYYRMKKMEHLLKDSSVGSDQQTDALNRYYKRLERLGDLYNSSKKETNRITEELDDLKQRRKEKEAVINELFSKFQNREIEIGTGLIGSKTGKPISDTMVEHLIHRQTLEAEQITKLRLKYILIRDRMAQKQAELKSLDNIGDDLSLMDYEQLKIENRAFADRLEEREEELTKLRFKCRNAIQIMAHVREKSYALETDMAELRGKFDDVQGEFIDRREKLNQFKTQRDQYRTMAQKLKVESGLLTKPNLLRDMEVAIAENKFYQMALQKLRTDHAEKTQKVRMLRKNIAYALTKTNLRKKKTKKVEKKQRFYKGRPTLFAPMLPKDLLMKLENIMSMDIAENKDE